jgi:hypothetical protein
MRYRDIYFELLPVFVLSTTTMGFFTGLIACKTHNPNDVFTQIVGYTSIGIMTGISFPVSFPVLGIYVLYKNKK